MNVLILENKKPNRLAAQYYDLKIYILFIYSIYDTDIYILNEDNLFNFAFISDCVFRYASIIRILIVNADVLNLVYFILVYFSSLCMRCT